MEVVRSAVAPVVPQEVASAGPLEATNALFVPHVPRLVVEWLRGCPDRKAQVVDGSLVFADVSGFTALSERLARRGKVGAEELVEVLNATTARLLGVASADGGSLIKFGGDALLLLFTGPEHAPRACRAAVGMRAALREAWRLRTSAGEVGLRISQGLHSGPIHFFFVGSLHRELILAGPAATVVANLEAAADAGEILISTETAGAIDARSVGDPKGRGRLLRRAPAAGPATLSLSREDVQGVDVSGAVPVAVREFIAGGGGDPEHRHVTIAFVRFDGLDGIIREDGVDRATEVLDDLVSRVQETCVSFGITFLDTDVYYDGGKLFLAAGAPRATGNDEERMLRAARAIVDLPGPLVLRAGVNCGPTFVHVVGPPFRRTYTAMGDTTNLAARLMQKAGPGIVLATTGVLERSRVAFETRALPPFTVKGKSQPVEAHEVGRVLGPRTAAAKNQLPLIGRDPELATLEHALRSAKEGEGRAVQLLAEAGAGKSRLLQELRSRSGDVRVLAVACDEYETASPYLPFRRLLRAALGIAADEQAATDGARLRQHVDTAAPGLRPWLPLVASVVGAEMEPTPEATRLDPAFRKAQLARAVIELLASVLTTPTLIVVEDAHWLDDASGDLLRRLVAELQDQPWLLCVARRPGEGPGALPEAAGVVTLELGPLGADAAVRLVVTAAGDTPPPPHVVDTITERAGGNPLFLLQLVAGAEGPPGLGLPAGVEAAVAARIDQLGPPDRTLLRAAAVLGRSFPMRLARSALRAELPEADDDAAWERLSEFLTLDRDDVRFRQPLVRDVAYEALPYRQRRKLHARAAETIEHWWYGVADQRAALLSLHWSLAGRWPEAWRWSREAGSTAAALGGSVEATQLFGRALDAAENLPDAPEELADVGEALGDAASLAGLFKDASRGYRLARKRTSDVARSAELLRKEGFIRERAARYDQARRWYRRGIRLCEEHRGIPSMDAARHRLELSYAAASAWEGRYGACIRYCQRVLVESDPVEERGSIARAYYLLDWAYTDLGRPEAASYRSKALPIYEELGDLVGQANVLNNLGVDAYYEGRWAEALDLWQRSRGAREQAGDLLHAADAAHNIAEILSDQGRLDEAEEQFQVALRVFRAAGYQAGMALGTSNLGRVAARQGRFDQALQHLEDAIGRFRDIGAERYVLETRARVAEVHILAGDHNRALAVIDPALEEARAMPGAGVVVAMLERLRGYGLVQAGERGGAHAAFSASLEAAEAATAGFEIALTLEARARLQLLEGTLDLPAMTRSAEIQHELGVVASVVVPLAPATVPAS